MRDMLPTIYGAAFINARMRAQPHEVLPFTTMNEAINNNTIVQNQPTPNTRGMQYCAPYSYEDDSINLSMGYFVIGNGGHRNVVGATDGFPYTDDVDHSADNSGLYRMIPFAVKPVSSDFTIAERARYRLRRTVDIGGVLHAAYFARKMVFDDSTSEIYKTTVSNGEPIVSSFTPTINNLRPTPPTYGVQNDGSYMSVSSPIVFDFTDDDVALLIEACTTLYGNPHYAVISELGLCTGVDKMVTSQYPATGAQNPSSANNPQVQEAVAVQLAAVMSTYYAVGLTNETFTTTLDLGSTIPLFGTPASS